jgi:virulence-associated protein VagC
MPLTSLFKSGKSQAVGIRADTAYPDTNIELEITWTGDVITIFPARGSLKNSITTGAL